MAANRQIGWSTEENLLWEIVKKFERLIGVTSTSIANLQTPTVYTITTTSSLTPDPVTYDDFEITTLSTALVINNPAPAPSNFDMFAIRITDNGTGRALSFGAKYRAQGASLPTTTVANKTMIIVCMYDATVDLYDTKFTEEQ